MSQNESEQGLESYRKEIFLARVTAQDAEMPVAQSRKEIAQRFGITEEQVIRIEREGLDGNWPPLWRNGNDNVRHDLQLAKVARRVQDAKVLGLLKIMLKASGKKGVPQGGVNWPLLGNLYSNEVDQMLVRAKGPLVTASTCTSSTCPMLMTWKMRQRMVDLRDIQPSHPHFAEWGAVLQGGHAGEIVNETIDREINLHPREFRNMIIVQKNVGDESWNDIRRRGRGA